MKNEEVLLTILAERAREVLQDLEGAVPSPCVLVCRIAEQDDRCEGCLRTVVEITAWRTMNEDQKRKVWREIGLRCIG